MVEYNASLGDCCRANNLIPGLIFPFIEITTSLSFILFVLNEKVTPVVSWEKTFNEINRKPNKAKSPVNFFIKNIY
jgi:hypothetical protein